MTTVKGQVMEEIAYIKRECILDRDPEDSVQKRLQLIAKRMIDEMERNGTTVDEFRSRFSKTGNMFLD